MASRKPAGAQEADLVGRSVPRTDGFDKVTGSTRYVDDLSFPGMLHGMTVRSSIPAGEVLSVALDFDTSGFTIVDYRDIPGRNVISAIDDDQPCLVEQVVRHAAEPILLLAHADREQLFRARVGINYRPGEPVFDAAKSPTVFKAITIEKGDLLRGFDAADVVVEGEYHVGHQEHAYIEPNGVIAVPSGDAITVYGSLQCPYYVHKALKVLLGLPADRVRVVQTETGRRLRRQGGLPVDHRRSRLSAGAQVGAPGQARLRPERGHARHDQAASGRHPPSYGRHEGRAAHGDGNRRAARRRRLRDAESRRALARRASRVRAVPAARTCG